MFTETYRYALYQGDSDTMQFEEDIGFIGGGRMGEALIQGIIRAGLAPADRIMVADPDENRRLHLQKTHNVRVFSENEPVLTGCSIIILAVKPQIMDTVLSSCSSRITGSHLIISIAAGISIAFIEKKLAGTGCKVIRVMPNAPALILEGASALAPGTNSSQEDLDKAVRIFNAVGSSVVLEEKYLDAVTGLSGSGPAYVFSFIEAMIDAGLKVGLSRDISEKLVLQTILGSVKMAMQSNEHPAQLRAMVTSPGGTTIAGLHEMEAAGFHAVIMNAVEAATERSRELGG